MSPTTFGCCCYSCCRSRLFFGHLLSLPTTPKESVAPDVQTLSQIANLSLEATPKVKKKSRPRILFESRRESADNGNSLDAHVDQVQWSEKELQLFTTFILLYTDGKTWVAHKNVKFWKKAGVFIQQNM